MWHRGWIAAFALAGFAAPSFAQPADPTSRPDPSGFLLPPVNVAAPAPSSRTTYPPPEPLRRVSAEDYPDDLPPIPTSSRSQPSSSRNQPAPSASRNSPPPPEDDGYPPPRRRYPSRYDTEPAPEAAPPTSKKPRRYDDEEYEPAPPKRKPQPQPQPREYDEYDREPAPAPVSKPRRYDDDEYIPPTRSAPAPKPPAPRYEDDEDYPPARPNNSRSAPAASIARPTSDRTVSERDLDADSASSKGKSNSDVDLIQYLTGGSSSDSIYQSTGLFGGDSGTDVLGKKPHSPLQSDHEFDTFVSPQTNVFLFEDPRSLTEIRPIFIYQKVPSSQALFGGGNLWYLGVQGRIAFTDRLSLVFHKFGIQGVNPSISNGVINDKNGLSELWLGPKYTFLRNTETGAVMAGGLQFQIPSGNSSVYQNTGTLSIVPYFSYAQNFLRSRAGSFNGLIGTGYAFSTNSERSDYYYLSAHLDYDIGNKHRFYPLAELTFTSYTTNGSSAPWQFEGRDLINFGSQAKGHNLLTGALGARMKITKSMESGFAFEIPFGGQKDLFDYRWTFDLSWRY